MLHLTKHPMLTPIFHLNRRTGLQRTATVILPFKNTYSYNAADRLTSVTDPLSRIRESRISKSCEASECR